MKNGRLNVAARATAVGVELMNSLTENHSAVAYARMKRADLREV